MNRCEKTRAPSGPTYPNAEMYFDTSLSFKEPIPSHARRTKTFRLVVWPLICVQNPSDKKSNRTNGYERDPSAGPSDHAVVSHRGVELVHASRESDVDASLCSTINTPLTPCVKVQLASVFLLPTLTVTTSLINSSWPRAFAHLKTFSSSRPSPIIMTKSTGLLCVSSGDR